MDFVKRILLVLSMMFSAADSKMSCIGKKGDPVDMYVLYKLPEIKWQKDVPDNVRNGSAYAYLDSKNMDFNLSPVNITSPESVAGLTLNQVYDAYKNGKSPSDQAHVFYNDANPEGHEYFTHGHTKGAMAFDQETGFWMVHSVPHFPDYVKNGYGYPHTGHKYGQMFLCITLNSSAVNDIGLQLRYNNPHVHDGSIPEGWDTIFPNIAALLKGEMVRRSPYYRLQEFASLGGINFTSFAKGTKFNKDLYSELVAPTLKTNLLTETWQNGGGNIGPSCDGPYTVEDISDVQLEFSDGSSYSFYDTNDHSKYALSDTADNPYVCIGDINRQTGQFKRGGGTVCTKNKALWERFHSLVDGINSCKSQFYESDLV
ncbi:plancitoxin-1-like [Clytia hemisphaerica]|uniref:Uncharacterized protein n=1 Tax=Clytia hemisphaerica TaxID=252671 RepID=A0A7M5X9H0_9CNID|eukprot:TCONS_00036639-protein